jgi:hypothetical protein
MTGAALLFPAVLVSAPAQAQEVPSSALPAAFVGDWKGTLNIRPVGGKAQQVPMELHVAPVSGGKAYRWQIVYGSAGSPNRQVRDYELVADEKRPGHFTLDEKNGIVLDADLVGGALCSAFRVQGNLLVTRYESPAAGRLRFEIVVYRADATVKTAPHAPGSADAHAAAPTPDVFAYPVAATQTAELTPIKPE